MSQCFKGVHIKFGVSSWQMSLNVLWKIILNWETMPSHHRYCLWYLEVHACTDSLMTQGVIGSIACASFCLVKKIKLKIKPKPANLMIRFDLVFLNYHPQNHDGCCTDFGVLCLSQGSSDPTPGCVLCAQLCGVAVAPWSPVQPSDSHPSCAASRALKGFKCHCVRQKHLYPDWPA